ncbi:MAG: M23 family metallopeptidase, partial [Alphaproteobacteria bacterium]|nr:M23 family metallopeptidase [Alphaproteobacteria bacterium]
MMIRARNIKVILITLIVGILIPLFSAVAAGPSNSGTSGSSCSKKCSDSKCHMAMNGSFFKTLAAKNNMNSKCLAEQSKNSCINTVPVSCGGSYNGLGYRPKGAGGNSKPRNHLGSDIGSKGCNPKNKILVYAAATGVVRYKSTAGCGGRTVLIEHNKACEGGGKYKTVYRHLLNYNVQIGQTVEKGKPIGVMGGSNAATAGSSPCDNPEQKGMPGYSRPPLSCSAAASKCGTPNYAIHLHIEFVDGAFSASENSSSAARNVLSPNCDTLPILCGGCPTSASSCGGSGFFTDGNSYSGSGNSYNDSSDFNDVNAAESETDSCVYDDTIEADSCVFCGMFKTVFNTASTIAKTANDSLAGPSATLVGIGFLIWLAIYILKQLSNFGGAGSGEMLKGIIYQGFRVAAVVLILNGFIYAVMDITLNPVMMTGLEFVQDINGAQACDKNAEYMKDIKGYDKTYQDSDISGGLSKQMGESIMCSVKHLENATGMLLRLGKYSVCISFGRYSWKNIIPNFFYLTTGIFLWICGLAVLLMFPFCLVDCIVQMCVAAALVPCAIAAFAFKVTAKYLKIIWGFFMNAMFNFVFMALVIYILNKYMLEWLGIGAVSPNSPEFDKMFVKALGGTPEQPALAWYGPAGLKILGIVFVCFCFM